MPGTPFHRPHAAALESVGELYAGLEERVQHLHENAALAYAHGAAWAIRTVLSGKRPTHVLLHREQDRYLLMGELADLTEGLASWSGSKRLHKLREEVSHRTNARRVAVSLSEEEELEEHEAAALIAALDSADGLAQAAYEYGELAQNALFFAIDRARTDRLPKVIR